MEAGKWYRINRRSVFLVVDGRFMLGHGAQELIHSVNSDMWTPLMIACDAGSLRTARVLVGFQKTRMAFITPRHT